MYNINPFYSKMKFREVKQFAEFPELGIGNAEIQLQNPIYSDATILTLLIK